MAALWGQEAAGGEWDPVSPLAWPPGENLAQTGTTAFGCNCQKQVSGCIICEIQKHKDRMTWGQGSVAGSM